MTSPAFSSGSPREPSPVTAAPRRATLEIRTLFALRDAGRRWPVAVRASLTMGVLVTVGVLAGDVSAGLMATIGGLTAIYGGARPYANRAVHLGAIAIAFALVVALGVWASGLPALGVLAVASIAMTATLVCNTLAVGPPGAYMFTLACAAGTGMHALHLSPLHCGLLVLGGGTVAWAMHMAGALAAPRAPEKQAVAAAGNAVASFVEAVGTPRQDPARHYAALALHEAWTTLVDYQPARSRPDGTVERLRSLNRDLHAAFATALDRAARGLPADEAAAAGVRRLAARAADPPTPSHATRIHLLPIGRAGVVDSLREGLRPDSPVLLTATRVGIAAVVAGAIGAAVGLDHAYWAIAASVLVLNQGFDWVRTVQRGLERTVGTLLGLVVAAAILSAHPQGIALVLTLMVLQFTIEMVVVRNYALAVIVITPLALVIASGGQSTESVSEFVLARGLDTVIGCAVALAVFVATARFAGPERRVSEAVAATLTAVERVLVHCRVASAATNASGGGDARTGAAAITDEQARTARRHLQHRVFALSQRYDAQISGSSSGARRLAEQQWPTVAATQQLAYRSLAVCWALEHRSVEQDDVDGEIEAIGRELAALRAQRPVPPGPSAKMPS